MFLSKPVIESTKFFIASFRDTRYLLAYSVYEEFSAGVRAAGNACKKC